MKKPWQSRYFEISAFTALLAVFVSGAILVMNNIGSIYSNALPWHFLDTFII